MPFKRDEYEDFGKCYNYSSPHRNCSCSCLLNSTNFVYNLCLYSRLSIVHGKRAFGTTADQFYSALVSPNKKNSLCHLAHTILGMCVISESMTVPSENRQARCECLLLISRRSRRLENSVHKQNFCSFLTLAENGLCKAK